MLAKIVIGGIIQGVGFRPFVYRLATANKLAGFVRNRGDAAAEIVVQGKEQDIDQFLSEVKEKKPVLARYDGFVVEKTNKEERFNGFSILASNESHEFSGSVIPPDISICDRCIEELQMPQNRRNRYPFNTCTECGPRFTITEALPYDRVNTTMSEFDLCRDCSAEYCNPLDRRFHAETISCGACGPQLSITDSKGTTIDSADPLGLAAKLLEEGSIIAVKGIGGFHVAASALNSKAIARLREKKNRKNKPFAVMAKNVESARKFAIVDSVEEKLLLSSARPIVLLKKRDDCFLSPLISPQLHNIGVMLPYTAMHILLLDKLPSPALVMTSANPSSMPMVKDNDEAFRQMDFVDYFLVHNRQIAVRCDDSVVRVNCGKANVVRRSRGYVPTPIYLKSQSSCILALGAELNNTFSVLVNNKAFMSQHIGDVESVETYQFLKDAVRHMAGMVNARPDTIACDLHPTMHTTRLAHAMAGSDLRLVQVQHHHAHAASLMAEHGVDEMIGIVCDGAGYGLDGKVWGGEVLCCNKQGFKRAGHLAEQPMVGGDLATCYPLRMVAGILYGKVDGLDEYLHSKSGHFPGGSSEVQFVLQNLSKSAMMTTSTGRILDAASALLGACYERTYEGEPAMKLESLAVGGNDLRIKPRIDKGVLDTTFLLQYVYENRGRHLPRDLAYSVHSYIARGLAEIACSQSRSTGIKVIGFSGGVAYNELVTRLLKQQVELSGLQFLQHESVPAGDAGISLGQVYVASMHDNFDEDL